MEDKILEEVSEEKIEVVDETTDSTPEENETPSSEEEKEQVVEPEADAVKDEPAPEQQTASVAEEEKDPKIPYGETPKEWALRKEVEKLKGKLRKERTDELFVPSNVSVPKEMSPERKKLLEKYDKEQLDELGEIIKAQAEEMGFVKKEELSAQTYKETADDILNSFLEEHKEYLPENDKDNILWNRFRDEFELYKQPSNPKDFKKIYNRIHETIFNVKSGNLNRINAQQEKIKVASHTGKTVGSPARVVKENPNIRLDGLKGFTEEELAELTS